jgi:hypothetical protein
MARFLVFSVSSFVSCLAQRRKEREEKRRVSRKDAKIAKAFRHFPSSALSYYDNCVSRQDAKKSPAFGKAIDGPGNTLLHDRRTETQQESELHMGESQVGQNLFLVRPPRLLLPRGPLSTAFLLSSWRSWRPFGYAQGRLWREVISVPAEGRIVTSMAPCSWLLTLPDPRFSRNNLRSHRIFLTKKSPITQ